MHIPDPILDVKTALVSGVLAAGGLGWALREARRRLPARRVPLMGLSAAFIFVAQMINFPVGVGTSGHLIGGVLAAVLLGPSAAVVVLGAVLIVQCFMFSDGGVTALGANVLNLAIVNAAGGYGVYAVVRRFFGGLRGRVMAAAFAGWCGTVLAAMCCAGQLAVSGVGRWSVLFPVMAGIHAVIGLGEGLITALVLVGIARARPELMEEEKPLTSRFSTLVYGVLACVGLALFVTPLASEWPDGLERAMGMVGFEGRMEAKLVVGSPMMDYRVPGLGGGMGTAVAGMIGMVVVFGLAMGLAWVLVPRTENKGVGDAS